MFLRTDGGFQMKLANDWTVSVQWGRANYCENRFERGDTSKSPDAEVWRWGPDGEPRKVPGWDDKPTNEDVRGWLTPDEVLAYIAETATF